MPLRTPKSLSLSLSRSLCRPWISEAQVGWLLFRYESQLALTHRLNSLIQDDGEKCFLVVCKNDILDDFSQDYRQKQVLSAGKQSRAAWNERQHVISTLQAFPEIFRADIWTTKKWGPDSWLPMDALQESTDQQPFFTKARTTTRTRNRGVLS